MFLNLLGTAAPHPLNIAVTSNGQIAWPSLYKFKNPLTFSSILCPINRQTTSAMASSKPRRSSCSFLVLLLSFFNFILFILSAASLMPIIALKMPPTSLGWAFLMVSTISMLSSIIGFYSQLTHFCYITHVSLLLSSSVAQLLGILALFTKEKSSLSRLRSPRDLREAKLLVRLECGILMAMFVMQLGVLVVTCAVRSCWVREYEDMEAEREAIDRKRRQRIARVQEEAMANAARIQEVKAKELDERMNNKYVQWVKNDFEG